MEIYFHAHLQQLVPGLAARRRHLAVADVTAPHGDVIIAAEVVVVVMVVKVMVKMNPDTGVPPFAHPVVTMATAPKEKSENAAASVAVVAHHPVTVVVVGGSSALIGQRSFRGFGGNFEIFLFFPFRLVGFGSFSVVLPPFVLSEISV